VKWAFLPRCERAAMHRKSQRLGFEERKKRQKEKTERKDRKKRQKEISFISLKMFLFFF
jgi:hypothetical protein